MHFPYILFFWILVNFRFFVFVVCGGKKMKKGLLVLLVVAFVAIVCGERSFTIEGDNFMKDGKPFQIRSGGIHYFRSLPSQWEDRMTKAKEMGLNAVQTYIAWNVHEPTRHSPPQYTFSGIANITQFFDIANDLDLLIILRPGPYICAEWDFGGLPGWLLGGGERGERVGRGLRTSDEEYERVYEGFMRALLAVVEPYLYVNGGPIVMTQVENEYGFYGNDKKYLRNLRDLYNNVLGEGNTIIYSTDPPGDLILAATQVEGIFQTCDFGPQPDWMSPEDCFAILRKYQPTGPLMNSEYYTGWISHWGDASMAHRSVAAVVEGVQKMLEMNASFNLYMFHGGSNWGFMNGANADEVNVLQVTLQSYDYDSPLTEAGDITPKYLALRELLLTTPFPYSPPSPPSSLPPLPTSMKEEEKGAYGKVKLGEQAGLWGNIGALAGRQDKWPFAPSFAQVTPNGPGTGFMLYKTSSTLLSPPLIFRGVRDYAQVYVDHQYQGTANRDSAVSEVAVNVEPGKQNYSLEILVENHGRLNFGPFLYDQKGLGLGPYMELQQIMNWDVTYLPMDDISHVKYTSTENSTSLPSFFKGTLTINDAPLDTYLSFKGWGKGHVYVNNFHIGRYWGIGPQYCVYIPAEILQKGANTIVLFELEQVGEGFEVEFLSSPNNVVAK